MQIRLLAKIHCESSTVRGPCKGLQLEQHTNSGIPKEHFVEQCYELCLQTSECAVFGIRISDYGLCTLKRAGCLWDGNPNWELFPIEKCKISEFIHLKS